MHLLLTLLLAHLFADFPLQSNGLARLKKRSLRGVFLHVMVYMGVNVLLFQDPFSYWPLILALTTAHFVIDACKLVCSFRNEIVCFTIDQLLHFVTVALAAYIAHRIWFPAPVGILSDNWLLYSFLFALALGAMVFCWLWIDRLSEEQVHRYVLLRWVKYQMLTFEQRLGLTLIVMIVASQRLW